MCNRRFRHGQKSLRFEALETRELLTVNMSPQEQLFLELVNRARANPLLEVARNQAVADLNQDVEEGEILPDPKQPLAPHQALVDAMIGHVQDMLDRDFFEHESPDGSTPTSRAKAAGYPVGAGENIAWTGNTSGLNRNLEVYARHNGLFESVGHRVNMMRDNWREIGPGIRYGSFQQDGTNYLASIMAGTLFGNRGGNNFITGVAIDDSVSFNNFYEIGEGLGNVLISAINTETQEVYSGRTGGSGGYSLQVPDGIYEVTATGGGLSRPRIVRGIHVNGENVKVDINTRSMNTRFIEGTVFADETPNNRLDNGEPVRPGHTVYLDLNDNDFLDVGEISTTTGTNGEYRFEELLPGEYVVRQIVSDGWEQPTEGAFFLNTVQRNGTQINFPLREVNQAPTAVSDSTSAKSGERISIDVAANDSDPEDRLATATIRITGSPQHGQANTSGGQISYRPDSNFVGTDELSYTISDATGQLSNVATVTINVSSEGLWQNPGEARDVDDNGAISPRDVLALINEINRVGAHQLSNRVKTASVAYFDVTGDNFLSPLDILSVIEYLDGVNAVGEPPTNTVLSTADQQPTSRDLFFASLANADEDDE